MLTLLYVGQAEFSGVQGFYVSTLCILSVSGVSKMDPTKGSENSNHTLRSYSSKWVFGISWGLL